MRTANTSFTDRLKQALRANDRIHTAALSMYMRYFFPRAATRKAAFHGLAFRTHRDRIDISQGSRVLRCHARHAVYVFDLIEHFDFFHGAVEPVQDGGTALVDYSEPMAHRVKGYDRHPIVFPAIAEPVETTDQYLDFAMLDEGSVGIDLGAYSGLTSIMFRERCGESGRVIAVEADGANAEACRTNFTVHEQHGGHAIELVEGAVWTHDRGLRFSAEGSMGSAATETIGDRASSAGWVPSFTLDQLATAQGLRKIDFIKCDVEGAEAVIFDDAAFFARFRPRMVVEVHPVHGQMTDGAVEQALARHGYVCKRVHQRGIDLPLLECSPQSGGIF